MCVQVWKNGMSKYGVTRVLGVDHSMFACGHVVSPFGQGAKSAEDVEESLRQTLLATMKGRRSQDES